MWFLPRRALVRALWFAVFAGSACGGSSSVARGSPSPSLSPSPSPSPVAKMSEWVEYHGDHGRAGLGPALPAIHSPSRAWTTPVDGQVYASPLIVSNRVLVATENNTVYSLDLVSGHVLWKSHLGTPVSARSLPCGNITPLTGITGPR